MNRSLQEYERPTLGLWVYLMTDCVLFGALFATFAVLHGNTAGGPSGGQIFDLPYVLIETLLLLASSFTCGLSFIAARRGERQKTMAWLSLTFILGATFLIMELSEFSRLAAAGHGWWQSAFLSAFFGLVGTHGAHIAIGLIWAGSLLIQVALRGTTEGAVRRLGLFALFWHFLDLIWIFIFTIVYLIGTI